MLFTAASGPSGPAPVLVVLLISPLGVLPAIQTSSVPGPCISSPRTWAHLPEAHMASCSRCQTCCTAQSRHAAVEGCRPSRLSRRAKVGRAEGSRLEMAHALTARDPCLFRPGAPPQPPKHLRHVVFSGRGCDVCAPGVAAPELGPSSALSGQRLAHSVPKDSQSQAHHRPHSTSAERLLTTFQPDPERGLGDGSGASVRCGGAARGQAVWRSDVQVKGGRQALETGQIDIIPQ